MEKDIMIEFAIKYYKNISHPLAVANQFQELSDEWIVGLFHDILEDTTVDPQDLMMLLSRFNKKPLFEHIEAITRKEDETYFNYIKRLHGVSKIVKIADLRHNLSRVETLKPSLKKRYEKALSIMMEEENEALRLDRNKK